MKCSCAPVQKGLLTFSPLSPCWPLLIAAMVPWLHSRPHKHNLISFSWNSSNALLGARSCWKRRCKVSGVHSMLPLCIPFHSFWPKGYHWCDLLACRDLATFDPNSHELATLADAITIPHKLKSNILCLPGSLNEDMQWLIPIINCLSHSNHHRTTTTSTHIGHAPNFPPQAQSADQQLSHSSSTNTSTTPIATKSTAHKWVHPNDAIHTTNEMLMFTCAKGAADFQSSLPISAITDCSYGHLIMLQTSQTKFEQLFLEQQQHIIRNQIMLEEKMQSFWSSFNATLFHTLPQFLTQRIPLMWSTCMQRSINTSLPSTVLLQPLVHPGIPVLVLDEWPDIPSTSPWLKHIGLHCTVLIHEWMTPLYTPAHNHYLQPSWHPLMVIIATWTG